MSFLETDFLLSCGLPIRSLEGLGEAAEQIEKINHCGFLNRPTIIRLRNSAT